jgi:type II secretory pathway pseudopilin PulG
MCLHRAEKQTLWVKVYLGVFVPKKRICTFVRRAMTIVEIIIAVSIMAILFAAILPQFRNMYLSWDSHNQRGEIVQNARVLLDCLSRSLASAIRITSVSMPEEPLGYIEFEKNDGNSYRIDISEENYIQYGPAGNGVDFAGPVSQLQFQCYGLEDMTTTTMEPDEIRLVKVSTMIYNPEEPSRTQAYQNQVFIETNAATEAHLLAWYKFDEAAGLVATDSSRYRRHGQLNNMTGAEWAEGYFGGGLEFDGIDDYVSFDLEWASESATLTGWAKVYSAGDQGGELININDTFGIRLDYDDQGSSGSQAFRYLGNGVWAILWGNDPLYAGTGWHHFAYVIDHEDNTFSLYVDGKPEAFSDMGKAFIFDPPVSTGSAIGRHAGGQSPYYLEGVIDDVRIYDIALTEEEIRDISPPALLHYWALDETGNTMIDSEGKMDGTCRGNVRVGELSFRDRFANCVYFDGESGWIALSADRQMNSISSFSVSAWIRPEETNWPAWIIGRDATDCGWSFGITDSTIILRIGNKKGDGSIEVPYTLAMEQWCHVAVVYNPDYEGLFYVNGEFVGMGEYDKKPSVGTLADSWAIGVCDGEDYFKGHIDEVKISGREWNEEQVKVIAGIGTNSDPYLESEIRP